VVLDSLKMMCPPPAGCPSLDYLRTAMVTADALFVEGAYTRQLQWSSCFDEKCSPTNLTLGDSIDFRYASNHNVIKVASMAAYTAGSLSPPPFSHFTTMMTPHIFSAFLSSLSPLSRLSFIPHPLSSSFLSLFLLLPAWVSHSLPPVLTHPFFSCLYSAFHVQLGFGFFHSVLLWV